MVIENRSELRNHKQACLPVWPVIVQAAAHERFLITREGLCRTALSSGRSQSASLGLSSAPLLFISSGSGAGASGVSPDEVLNLAAATRPTPRRIPLVGQRLSASGKKISPVRRTSGR